ncbi:MAG: carbohydrate kinase family protein [Planctomycetales bacterium]|nr:carbohydrate kinase family protein [Planctomycetales bacterium]
MSDDVPEVLGLGMVVVDHQVVLPSFPSIDTKNQIESDRYQVGGPVPTALAMVCKLGNKAKFIGKWSDDAFGRIITADLQDYGIDFDSAMARSQGRTGFAHVWIDQSTGSRTVAYLRGDAIEVDDVTDIDVDGCKVLHLDGWSGEAAWMLASKAKASGATIVMDAGSPKPWTATLLSLVDVVNCPKSFATEFYGITGEHDAAARLINEGVTMAVFTQGSRGATAYRSDGKFHIPAFPVSAIDTNGAGDVFCGGLIYGLLQSYSPEETVRFASACAALKCQAMGNRESLPSLDAASALMNA